jgi:hypothetical protein
MTDAELYVRARRLAEKAKHAKFPALIPKIAREAIQEAAELIFEIAKREAERCHAQKITENP